ncbi:MAG: UbiA prenyltransferase family protein [Candidatus Hodarchaeales archaeon]|jgi:geranylgeranylglycerol-phosphate geranylgeranyltransferase
MDFFVNVRKNKGVSFLYLFRSFESLLLSGTWIALFIITGQNNIIFLLIVGITVWLTNAGITSWNDSLDIKEDSISHPERPIPSGLISVKEARFIGSVLFGLALVFSYFISEIAIFYILGAIIIGISYSIFSKKQFLAKNLTVTISIFLGLLIGVQLFSSINSSSIYIFIASIALLLSGYEIIKDFYDVEGDSKAGIDTIPLRYGFNVASYSAFILFVLSCLLMFGALLLLNYDVESYITLITTLVISFPLLWLIRNPSPANAEAVRKIVIIIIGIALTLVTFLVYFRSIS